MFKEDDVKKYRAMKSILKQGKFEVKGDAVLLMASLFKWFDDLESKIAAGASPSVLSEPIKKLEDSDADNA